MPKVIRQIATLKALLQNSLATLHYKLRACAVDVQLSDARGVPVWGTKPLWKY
jgi:hypothetical protein